MWETYETTRATKYSISMKMREDRNTRGTIRASDGGIATDDERTEVISYSDKSKRRQIL